MLIILSGLPGAGKTTIAKALAAKFSAAYVRVDEIENALFQNGRVKEDIGSAGYIVAFAIARSNLSIGDVVIADSVNPVPESRQGWRSVAEEVGAKSFDVELVCSVEVEHRRRVENRQADILGLQLRHGRR